MKIDFKQLYLDHKESSIEFDWSGNYDYQMSSEITADNYTVYLCQYPESHVQLSEDVFMYSHDLTGVLKDRIDEGLKIFIDEEIYDELYIQDEWEQWCVEADLVEYDDDIDEWVLIDETD